MKYKLKKFIDLIRYDLPRFVRNVFVYRKALWQYRNWDYSGLLHLMETAARDMHECHKNHGHLMKADQTAKELLIWAELLRRVREDQYDEDKQESIFNGKGIFGGEFVQKPNTLPNRKAKSFYKLVQMQRRNDVKLIAKMFERKVFSWWE
ncbi:hypothetical protein D3C85_293040 [compost metagenome]